MTIEYQRNQQYWYIASPVFGAILGICGAGVRQKQDRDAEEKIRENPENWSYQTHDETAIPLIG